MHSGLMLSLNLISFTLYILGHIGVNILSIVLVIAQAYMIYIYLLPIVRSPQDHIEEWLKLNLPLMCLSGLWSLTSLAVIAITALTPLTAIALGVTLSLSARYLYLQLFFAFMCLEFALLKQSQLGLGMSVYHAGLHIIAAVFVPRLLTPKWVISTFYPRLLSIDELPLSHRYFDPNRFKPIRYTNTADLRKNSQQASVYVSRSDDDGDSSAVSVMRAVQDQPDPSSEVRGEIRAEAGSEIRAVLPSVKLQAAPPPPTRSSIINAAVAPPMMNITGLVTGLVRGHMPAESLPALREVLRDHNINTQDFVSRSLDMHLELARRQLHADSAILLWSRPVSELLGVRAYHSSRDTLELGDYSIHDGILESALREEVKFQEPVSAREVLPYYRADFTVGGIISVPIKPYGSDEVEGALILDRNLQEPWDRHAFVILRQIAEKIKLDLDISSTFQQMISDCGQVERLCYCLQRLNETFDVLEVERLMTESLSVYDGFESASYFTLQAPNELKLRARWVHPLLEETVGSAESERAPLMSVGEVIPLYEDQTREHALSWVVHQAHELSTLEDEITPLEFIKSPSWLLSCAAGAIAIPVCEPEDDRGFGRVMGVLLLTVSDDSVLEPRRLQSFRLLLEQIEVKLSLVNAHAQLKRMASRDGLTGLKNHITFQSESREMLSRAERDQSALAFVLLDIDHFKSVNDNYGHPFGDLVLKRVAEALERSVREVDLLARYGGEEFALALHATDLSQALVSVERARSRVERLEFEHEGRRVSVTISLGVACYPLDSRSHERLIERADKALYQSKRSGRNRVTAWRDIEPEARDSSVSWTRAPMSVVAEAVDSTEWDQDELNQEDWSRRELQQGQALSFNLDDLEITPRERRV